MARTGAALSLFACLAIIAGCGGGSGSSSSNNGGITLINIQTARFVPKNATTPVNSSVQWTNLDSVAHQVTSGTLDPTPTPTTVGPILITRTILIVLR